MWSSDLRALIKRPSLTPREENLLDAMQKLFLGWYLGPSHTGVESQEVRTDEVSRLALELSQAGNEHEWKILTRAATSLLLPTIDYDVLQNHFEEWQRDLQAPRELWDILRGMPGASGLARRWTDLTEESLEKLVRFQGGKGNGKYPLKGKFTTIT